MLSKNDDLRVRVYSVWVPKRGGKESDVPEATTVVPDGRSRHFWDGAGWTLRSFRPALNLPAQVDAWDVYLLYGPDTRWDQEEPPAPAFWMHQLYGADGPELDPAVFAQRLAEILKR